MFGKKKEKILRVMHYEGIESFATDYPCTLKIANDELIIKRTNPEATVTLPLSRIKSFSAMEEKNFMLQYHNQAITTSKAKGINKYYLVVKYDKGILAFWGGIKEYGEFIKLQQGNFITPPNHIEL